MLLLTMLSGLDSSASLVNGQANPDQICSKKGKSCSNDVE